MYRLGHNKNNINSESSIVKNREQNNGKVRYINFHYFLFNLQARLDWFINIQTIGGKATRLSKVLSSPPYYELRATKLLTTRIKPNDLIVLTHNMNVSFRGLVVSKTQFYLACPADEPLFNGHEYFYLIKYSSRPYITQRNLWSCDPIKTIKNVARNHKEIAIEGGVVLFWY